jgi:hypothetical protein
LDDLARFLEYESSVCLAIFLKDETIYVALNKFKKKTLDRFFNRCKDLFNFFKMLIEVGFGKEQDEKDVSVYLIYRSYTNNAKVVVNSASEQLISIYYDELEKDDLLKVKCKLFVRFKKFVKSLTLNESKKYFMLV